MLCGHLRWACDEDYLLYGAVNDSGALLWRLGTRIRSRGPRPLDGHVKRLMVKVVTHVQFIDVFHECVNLSISALYSGRANNLAGTESRPPMCAGV